MVMSVVSGILWFVVAAYAIVAGPRREYLELLQSEDDPSSDEQLDMVICVLQAAAIGVLCFTGWLFVLFGHVWISVAMGTAMLLLFAERIRRSIGRLLPGMSVGVVAAMPCGVGAQHYVHAELSVAFASATDYGLLSGMAFGGEGELYVLDVGEYRLISFSSTGEIRGTWGRRDRDRTSSERRWRSRCLRTTVKSRYWTRKDRALM